MTYSLQGTIRTERGKKLGVARKAGKLPAVVYGAKQTATSLFLDQSEFERVFKEVGLSSVFTLKGLDADADVLVHDVAFDAARGGVIHVDLIAIEAGKEITVNIPLEFIGEAPALKLGGTLTKVMHEIEVTCKPKDLPKEFEVDISVLVDLESQIHVSDLKIPTGVKIESNPEDLIVLIQEVVEEVEAEVAPVDMDAIEVEKKGKTEEAGEDGEAK